MKAPANYWEEWERNNIKGFESEATHYNTFGNILSKYRFIDGYQYYWDALSKRWSKMSVKTCCTPIGEDEPNFRCGPPKPIAQKRRSSSMYLSNYDPYYANRNRGSRIAGD